MADRESWLFVFYIENKLLVLERLCISSENYDVSTAMHYQEVAVVSEQDASHVFDK